MVALERLFINPSSTIRQAMTCLNQNTKGIALVVDQERRLAGTISDGDIRRAMLRGAGLEMPVQELLASKVGGRYPQPVTAPAGSSPELLLQLMQERFIRHIPLLAEDGRVVDMVTLDELIPKQHLPMQAVIMAGGFGTRLHPLTLELPKPLLPVGDRPLMELIVNRLHEAGIHQVNVATHYLGEKIKAYFGDGHSFGVEISYVSEEQPLGTVGALGLMKAPTEPLLVINGDILTRVDFRAMLAFHRRHNADLTVAVRQYELQVPYGVMESEGPYVRRVQEKPHLTFLVNAGIYLLEPTVHRYIPCGQRFDMTDLIERLLQENRPVANFPILEYWLDIG
ncbi:MAG: nucleotidyltransferase family protein, partial [Chloroflexi bacterium]|nr:nucleotidyltransferase family protein [Chloroflexota bacterium]